MNKHLFLLVFVFWCGSLDAHSAHHGYAAHNDSTVRSSFSLKHDANSTIIEIKYEVSLAGSNTDPDSTEVTVTTYLRDHPGGTVLVPNGMKNEMIRIIQDNPHIESVIEYSEDMKMIFNLINGKSKRKKAMKIYKDANPEETIRYKSTTNYALKDGYYQDTATYLYTFTLLVNKRTTLIIPEFVFTHNSKVLKTKELVIELE